MTFGPRVCASRSERAPLSEAEQDMVMHVELPILGGHVIMATDMLASMGHELRLGNNVTINLEPDSREETQRLFDACPKVRVTARPWLTCSGVRPGNLSRQFGVRWMFNFVPASQ